MGEIVGAALVAHVPTIVLPEDERRTLNEGLEISLVPGLERMRREQLQRLRPDTVIVIDSHWFTTVETVVTSAERRTGHFTSSELPRGMSAMPYDLPGDPELAEAIAKASEDIDQCWVTPISDPYLPVFYPTVNLAHHLQGDEAWISVSCVQTGDPADFANVGACIARAVEATDRRVVVLASGAMSHTFWPLRQLRHHEASDPVHIFTEQARAADQAILDAWSRGDHAAVIDGMDAYLEFKPEARFAHYLTMVEAVGGRRCAAVGEPYSDYENSIGTAQIHVWFERPPGGWTGRSA